MNKQSRLIAIRQIIAQHAIGTQDDLCLLLNEAGHEVTQATLSRDLKELGVARMNTPEGARYTIPVESGENRLRSFISYEIVSIEWNESLIIVRTLPGRAQGVAEILDNMPETGILGTLAGDNTIFIAPRSVKKIKEIVAKLRELIAQ
jgi:transcriptional regulator of arginine metabolism